MSSKDTRNAIKQCVLEKMKQKNISDIKVTEVVQILGISRGTFYLNFDSIYSVLQELEDEFFEGFFEQMTGAEEFPFSRRFFEEPHPYIVKGVNYLRENRDLILTLYGRYGDPLFQNKTRKLIERYYIRKAVEEGYLADDFNVDYIKGFLVGGHIQMTLDWLRQADPISPEKLAVQIFRVMFGFYLNLSK